MNQKPKTPSEMVEELQTTGKYICGVNGLQCSFCELYCEHRRERDGMSLINREDLIAEYDRVHVGPPGGARKLIEEALEVKPRQPEKGEWVKVYHNGRKTTGHIECSICGWWRSGDWTKHNFCPNCGADMREEKK